MVQTINFSEAQQPCFNCTCSQSGKGALEDKGTFNRSSNNYKWKTEISVL